MDRTITIVTPTYNRAGKLPRLFQSLCNQTCKDFEWLCIDDGSTDNTASIVRDFQKELKSDEGNFTIRYIRKANGGKHSALNVAFKMVETELLFIVDSDDVLTPDAIETITTDWQHISDKDRLCGIGYLRGYSESERIGDAYSQNRFISNFIEERYNRGTDGDKAEVWVTGKLRLFQFPEMEGEKFISESVAWIWLAKQYDMLFVNRIIYITEYLAGGLSDSGKALRFQCPRLMAYGSEMTMSPDFSWKIRIKETLLFIVYSLFGKQMWKGLLMTKYKGLVIVCFIPGLLLYRIWKRKYKI